MPQSFSAPIRWGILGCGDVTEVKSGPGFQRAVGSELVAVMRRNADLVRDYAHRHNVPRWYDDADALVNDKGVDAVYIATPPGTHELFAMKALAAGKPTYVEKPMGRNHAECRRMVDAFASANVPLFVAFYRRGLPRFQKVKELVDAGRLGTVTGVGYRFAGPAHRPEPGATRTDLPWRFSAEHSGGGIFLDVGSHTLDILDYILGPLSDVTGFAANLASDIDVEDNVAMAFRVPSGALGTASWNFAAGYKEDRVEITGTKGRVSFSVSGGDSIQMQSGPVVESFDLPSPKHVQQPLIQTIVNQLLGKGKSPSTGESAARTSAVMDTVLESYYGSRADGFWEYPANWPGRRR